MTVMYHCSARDNRPSILINGLMTCHDNTGLGAIFLADELPTKEGNMDVWSVDTSKLDLEEDFTGEPDMGQWWMVFHDIPASQIERLRLL